jgi:hypothetical protein
MFKDEYQQAISKVKPSQELIDATCIAVLADIATRKTKEVRPQRNRHFFRSMTAVATVAAIFCLVVFGTKTFVPNGDNMFSLKAYAMDAQNIMRPVDDGNGAVAEGSWSGYIDIKDTTALINVDIVWKVEGENIKQVEFTADSGFFTKKIGRFNFERITEKVILNGDAIKNGDAVYWGCEVPVKHNESGTDVFPSFESPQSVTIYATATFKNGETRTQKIIFNMSDSQGMYQIRGLTD